MLKSCAIVSKPVILHQFFHRIRFLRFKVYVCWETSVHFILSIIYTTFASRIQHHHRHEKTVLVDNID